MTTNKREYELKRRISHVKSVIYVLEGNDAGVYEKSPIGNTEIILEHDTKSRMLNTMDKYLNSLQEELSKCGDDCDE